MRAWLKWAGLWTLLGLVSGAQLYVTHRRIVPDPYTWWQALGVGLFGWYLWGLFSVVVAWLARRFPVDRVNFGRHFIIHLGASLNLALLHVVAGVGIQELLVLPRAPYPFADRLVDTFTAFYHWNVLIYWAIAAVVHALDHQHDLDERRAYASVLEARLQAITGGGPVSGEAGLARRHAERLLVGDDGRRFFVRAADVEWIEAAKNYVRLHVGDRTHTLRSTLGALERRLDPGRFRRINRSAVVNLDRVKELQPWFHGDAIVILQSGVRLSLGRRYRGNLVAPDPA
jgi:hypothetical protein